MLSNLSYKQRVRFALILLAGICIGTLATTLPLMKYATKDGSHPAAMGSLALWLVTIFAWCVWAPKVLGMPSTSKPTIYVQKRNKLVAVVAEEDYQLACTAVDRFTLADRTLASKQLRPTPLLMGYFSDESEDFLTGSMADYELLKSKCLVREVEMQVGKPSPERAVELWTLYRLIFGEESLKRAVMKLAR